MSKCWDFEPCALVLIIVVDCGIPLGKLRSIRCFDTAESYMKDLTVLMNDLTGIVLNLNSYLISVTVTRGSCDHGFAMRMY